MALAVTSLSGAIKIGDTQMTLEAFTNPASSGISAPTAAVIDGETVYITNTTNAPTVGITRGMESVTPGVATRPASAHNNGAPVVYGLTSDFTQQVTSDGIAGATVISYSASGAITVPINNTTIYLNGGGVQAMTLAGPADDQTNQVTVVSLTAHAHTITYTAGFYQNTTSSDVVTFPSTSGACWIFQAKNGVWNATLGGGTTGGVTGPA